MRILIAFPLVMVLCLGIQEAGRHIERAQRVEEALLQCYDAPDTTDEECEAFADSGAIHPAAQ